MNRVYYYFTFVFFLFSCSAVKAPVNASDEKEKQPPDSDYVARGYTKATVIDLSGLDGCKFLLKLEDGSRLQPENLDSAFAKENNPVWVKFYLRKNAMSICMAGKAVHITEILQREP